jgi:hypothetical protein
MKKSEIEQHIQAGKRTYEKPVLILLNCTSETYGKDQFYIPEFTVNGNGPS